MAEGTMANYTQSILIHTGHPEMIVTKRVNGASELKPGYVCTQTGHTDPDIGKPDAVDDVTLGIVLRNADQDIDTYYPDNDEVTVAMRGSGAIVWCYAQANCGNLVQGQPVYSTGASDDGYVVPWTVTDAPAAYAEADMQTELDKVDLSQLQFVGLVYKYSANNATDDRPIQVVLV